MDWDRVQDFFSTQGGDLVARLILIIGILAATWLVRRIVQALVPTLVRLITHRIRPDLHARVVEAIEPPLGFAVTVVGWWFVLVALELPRRFHSIGTHIINSLIALALFWGLYRSTGLLLALLRRVGRRGSGRIPGSGWINDQVAFAAEQITRAVIVILAATVIIEEWGYNVGGLVAGFGITGLAVALAAQDTLANVLGYFVILADEPFVIGEYIIINDIAGTVEGIGFRSTRVRVLDQSLVTIPNKTVMNANITNWSRLTKRRLNMTLRITRNISSDQVLSIVQQIRDMLRHHKLVQQDSVVVQFVEINENALDIMIICFMTTPGWNDFQAARQDINLQIMDILTQCGIVKPTPPVIIEPQAEHKPLPGPRPEPIVPTATDSPVPDDAAN
ncbi:MAG: mechanosensitive ion channel family protein [Chloroflexi bacterium]|nr:mechanosensitive ion channel family protein [Chloroflexota bacterium]